jgi:hypothetical protein
MKAISATILFIILTSQIGFSQTENVIKGVNHKGDFYLYWGWNWGWYSRSDIHFKGADYDFTLDNVIANDRQTAFDYDVYLNPSNISIPQFNFRMGYFISNHYNISLGIDHMKYVMQPGQPVTINGNISTGSAYDGVYSDDIINLEEDFLKFEHTDGLNYVNIEMRRFDELIDWNKVKVNLTEGAGIGFLYPRTNTTLLNKERYDDFNLAGYGFSAVFGVNISFYKYFFIQSELKGGFIHMPDIRTTMSTDDKADQHFFFGQANILFGATFNLLRKKS